MRIPSRFLPSALLSCSYLAATLFLAAALLASPMFAQSTEEAKPRPPRPAAAPPATPPAKTQPQARPPAENHPGASAPGGARPGVPVSERQPVFAPGYQPSRPVPSASRVVPAGNGTVVVRNNGRPMDVRDNRNGMEIHHNLVAGQRVVVEKGEGTRIAFERGRPGYVEHPYVVHGVAFEQRTYVYNNHTYTRFYRPYFFHGAALEVYTPAVYYPASYYGWLYRPWRARVYYRWGFVALPWYSFYGVYFQPYPYYVAPAFWLTDYLFSQSLADYYATQQADGYSDPAYSGPPLSPDVKQLVSNEVQGEIALDTEEANLNQQQVAPDPAASSVAALFADGQTHVFVAGREVDVVDLRGNECAITDGDVVRLTVPPGPNDTAVTVQVVASKGGADCRVNDNVNIALADLQEMQNHMHETVDQGMQQLAAQQGQGGLPAADAPVQGTPSFYAQNAPPPDPAVAQQLAQQAQAAQSSDQQLTAQASAAPTPAAVALSLGQSFSDVAAQLGAPTQVVQLGSKTIYVYPSTKVTFVDGKVTDIQ